MGQRIEIELSDDIDGTEAALTVRFSFGSDSGAGQVPRDGWDEGADVDGLQCSGRVRG